MRLRRLNLYMCGVLVWKNFVIYDNDDDVDGGGGGSGGGGVEDISAQRKTERPPLSLSC